MLCTALRSVEVSRPHPMTLIGMDRCQTAQRDVLPIHILAGQVVRRPQQAKSLPLISLQITNSHTAPSRFHKNHVLSF